jgi:shikimate kinase
MADVPQPPPRSLIFLIGFRGTGKSTVARLLAARLGWTAIDADELLESRAGMSIRRIFEIEGESGFRARESAILEELCHLRNHVIATGGGVVLDPRNQELMKQAATVVWLTADAATIWQRMLQDASTADRRPALTIGGLAEVEQLLQVREPLYRACADHCVATGDQNLEQVVEGILARMSIAN